MSDGRDFAAEAIIWLGKGESLLEKFEAKFEGAASSKEIKVCALLASVSVSLIIIDCAVT